MWRYHAWDSRRINQVINTISRNRLLFTCASWYLSFCSRLWGPELGKHRDPRHHALSATDENKRYANEGLLRASANRSGKCNRQWPCNHCYSRKIPHCCKFASKRNAKSPPSLDQTVYVWTAIWLGRDVLMGSRTPPPLRETGNKAEENEDASSELRALGTKDELRILGYLADDHSLLGKPQVIVRLKLIYCGKD